jgi:4-coumarate--CoA ligase
VDPFTDVCVLPYSSGTTGVPKGVMLTHHNMVANICQTAWGPDTLKVCLDVADESKQPVTVCVLPMYHCFAMNVTMGPSLYNGGNMIMLPKFDPALYVAALAKYKVSSSINVGFSCFMSLGF